MECEIDVEREREEIMERKNHFLERIASCTIWCTSDSFSAFSPSCGWSKFRRIVLNYWLWFLPFLCGRFRIDIEINPTNHVIVNCWARRVFWLIRFLMGSTRYYWGMAWPIGPCSKTYREEVIYWILGRFTTVQDPTLLVLRMNELEFCTVFRVEREEYKWCPLSVRILFKPEVRNLGFWIAWLRIWIKMTSMVLREKDGAIEVIANWFQGRPLLH